MRIEILEDFRHEGQIYYKDEVRVVTDQQGGYFCGLGWAKAAEYPTGTRDLTPKTLEINKTEHGLKTTELGVK